MRIILYLACLFVFAAFTVPADAQTNAFTYQGHLTDAAAPANGTYQMQFTLCNVASGTGQIGQPVSNNSVTVTNGIFSVRLDFSPVIPFIGGEDRWIEIAIHKPGDPPGFTILSPRQQITAAPYATYAVRATTADEALFADSVAGIVDIGNGGTGSSTKSFVDLTTNQTVAGNKTFTGTLSGSGSGLTNVPGTFKWQVADNFQPAEANHGYLANDAVQVAVILLDTPNIHVGDTLRVAGAGAGGWQIRQNAGQQILIPNGTANTTGAKNWMSIASSSDGTKLVAVAGSGLIFTSTDSGGTWIPRDSARSWRAVASSSDGTKLVASVDGGLIYTSTDSGVSWIQRESSRRWVSVASSSDGIKLVAADVGSGTGGHIYTSTDSGVSWIPRESNRSWVAAASSSDGTKLVAVEVGGFIYTSIDSGLTWTPRDSSRFWVSVASSSDGTKLVAGVQGGQIYTSTNSGLTWTPRDSNRDWFSVASSSDGTKLVAGVYPGLLYTSTNSGLTWTPRDSSRLWLSVASSADGVKLAAVVFNGLTYTSIDSGLTWSSPPTPHGTTTGTTGSISGSQSTSVELIYIGGGQFLVLTEVGSFSIN